MSLSLCWAVMLWFSMCYVLCVYRAAGPGTDATAITWDRASRATVGSQSYFDVPGHNAPYA
jgi:hypothetical protein